MVDAVTTPHDELPIEIRRRNWGWFGPPWWSYVCYDLDGHLIEEMRKPFPVGESCLFCTEPFDEAAGDSGTAMPAFTHRGTGDEPDAEIRHVHKECTFMNVMGSLAHHDGRCRAHGDGSGTGLTLRQEAVEVWRRHQEGTLFG